MDFEPQVGDRANLIGDRYFHAEGTYLGILIGYKEGSGYNFFKNNTETTSYKTSIEQLLNDHTDRWNTVEVVRGNERLTWKKRLPRITKRVIRD